MRSPSSATSCSLASAPPSPMVHSCSPDREEVGEDTLEAEEERGDEPAWETPTPV